MHIGIDPGLKGGLAALSDIPGLEPISVICMPTARVDGKPQVQTLDIVQWVRELNAPEDTHVWLERCPGHANSQASMRSMALNYGRMLGIFEARFPRMRIHRVRCGRELAGWQRQLLGDFTAETSKEKALEVARGIWPEMAWPQNSKGAILDGPVDSALIGHWGLLKTLQRGGFA